MAPVEGITRIVAGEPFVRPRAPQSGKDAEPADGRALIPVVPASSVKGGAERSRRPVASFLAHLIATAEQVPQTRIRRRAEPEVALAAYRVTARLDAPDGHRFVRNC
jgi:hypothetical protein